MIYAHVPNRGPGAVRSPADTLLAEPVDRAPADDQPILVPRYAATSRSLTQRSEPERQ